jgi:NADH-quinone oxidoreductase subunit H
MRRRALLPWLFAALVGCTASDGPPELVTVLDFVPRELEVGERIEVSGTGFPEGTPSTLTFRGDLCRAAEPTVRNATVMARATPSHGNRLSLLLTEELLAEFSGTGAEAAHTTFRGDVVAAFAPRRAGAPPITGTLRDVAIDFPPPEQSEPVLERRRADATRVTRWLGMELEEDPARGGLTVAQVAAQGRADQAGLLKGDVLVEFDGTRVRQPTDVVPRAGQRLAKAVVKRPGIAEPVERTLSVEGARPAAPAELTVAAVMVGLATAILLLLGAPLSRLLDWTERRLALRLRTATRAERSRPRSRLGWALWTLRNLARDVRPSPRRSELLRVLPPLALIAVSALFTALASGVSCVAPELDLPLLLASSITSLATAALIVGGRAEGSGWSLRRGLSRALCTLGCQIPAIAACTCAVLATGSLRPDLLVESQGALPWQWATFRSPIELGAGLLFVLSLVPEASPAAADLPEAETPPGRCGSESVSRALGSAVEWTHLLVAGFLMALFFLGGWKLPFVSPSLGRYSVLYRVIGAAWFSGKAWAVVVSVLVIRWAVGRVRVDQIMGLCFRWLVPLSIATLGLAAVWGHVPSSPVLHSLSGVTSIVLFGLCVFMLLRLGRRVISECAKSDGQLGINPWL